MLWFTALRRYAQFSSRAGRAEFWQFFAFWVAALAAGFTLDATTAGYYGVVPTFGSLALLGLTIPFYAVAARRLHDRGLSGWVLSLQWALNGGYFNAEFIRNTTRGFAIDEVWGAVSALCVILSVALAIYLLVQLVQRGDPEPNRYGAGPEGPGVVPPGLAAAARSFTAAMRPPAPSAAPNADPVAQLERLAALRQQGVLSQTEFDQQKAVLLGTADPA